jgi:hypothetical protein
MLLHTITRGSAAVAIATLLSFTPAQAAMSPALHTEDASVQRVDCAVGFHIGPAGACVIGTEERHDTVIERRAADEGCRTKSVTRSDDTGTETRTKTNCD